VVTVLVHLRTNVLVNLVIMVLAAKHIIVAGCYLTLRQYVPEMELVLLLMYVIVRAVIMVINAKVIIALVPYTTRRLFVLLMERV